MVRFHLAGNPVSHSEFLSDELKIFTAGTEGATIEIERLKQYSKVCDSRQTMRSCIKKADKLLFGSYPPPPTPLLYFSDSPSCLPFAHLLSSFLVELEQQEWSLCLSSPLNFVNLLWLFRYFGRIVMKEVPLVNLFKKWNSETWKFSSFAERLKKNRLLFHTEYEIPIVGNNPKISLNIKWRWLFSYVGVLAEARVHLKSDCSLFLLTLVIFFYVSSQNLV